MRTLLRRRRRGTTEATDTVETEELPIERFHHKVGRLIMAGVIAFGAGIADGVTTVAHGASETTIGVMAEAQYRGMMRAARRRQAEPDVPDGPYPRKDDGSGEGAPFRPDPTPRAPGDLAIPVVAGTGAPAKELGLGDDE